LSHQTLLPRFPIHGGEAVSGSAHIHGMLAAATKIHFAGSGFWKAAQPFPRHCEGRRACGNPLLLPRARASAPIHSLAPFGGEGQGEGEFSSASQTKRGPNENRMDCRVALRAMTGIGTHKDGDRHATSIFFFPPIMPKW
jgi:hypothetical protein